MCSGGAVPAQLQTTQLTTKQITGEKYITINDKATSSWIDFGCKKLMWIMALLAAVLVVAVVATGGAALAVIVAAGAAAGAAGAVFGAVLGALICGQKAAPARVWNQSKSDLIIQGHQAITGDHTMTCRLFGETIRFAPNIKNWWQAIGVGALNYVTGIVEGALTGALVGLGGGIASGAASLGIPTLSSVAGNVAASFGVIGAPVRALFGANAAVNSWALGATPAEAQSEFLNSAVPEYASVRRILSGQAQAGDAMLLLYLLRLKTPSSRTPQPRNQGQTPKPTGKGKNGKAYEDPKPKNKTGETESTAIGKDTHKKLADERRASGQWSEVNTPMTDKSGKTILVPKRVDLKTGKPQPGSKLQDVRPDAVNYDKRLILDDKPLGRPIAKDRQEIIRFIKAYEIKQGHLPEKIVIQRYDPVTGNPVVTEIYTPGDFLP